MLRTPICDLFGIEHPIFLAGMGGVAYARVCAAVSEAGGFGTLGMVAASPARIREEMREVRKLTRKPFGVDMLAALPEQMNAAIDTIIEEGAAAFITGLGVAAPLIEKCHRHGVKVMAVCGKVSHAQRAEQAGCDAVVAQGTEAGGHTGQVAGFALLPQTVDAVRIPVLAAGAIVDGRGLAAALAFGAQGVWVGTRFVASSEANAARVYKQRIVDAEGDQTSITRVYSGKPMRVIRNDYVSEWEKRDDELLPFPQQLAASVRAGVMGLADEAADPGRACMPAGQGVGGIHEVLPSRDIIERMLAEARDTLLRLRTRVRDSRAHPRGAARPASRPRDSTSYTTGCCPSPATGSQPAIGLAASGADRSSGARSARSSRVPARTAAITAAIPLLRLAHAKRAASERLAVQRSDRRARRVAGLHLHETEAARATGLAVRDDRNRFHGPVFLEQFAKLVFRAREGKVAYIDLRTHTSLLGAALRIVRCAVQMAIRLQRSESPRSSPCALRLYASSRGGNQRRLVPRALASRAAHARAA